MRRFSSFPTERFVTLPPSSDQLAWIASAGFDDPATASQSLDALRWTGIEDHRLSLFFGALADACGELSFPDATIEQLTRIITAAENPKSTLASMIESVAGLTRLVRTVDAGPAISARLVSDPGVVSWILDDDRFEQPVERSFRELVHTLTDVHSSARAATLVRNWYSRQMILTAAHEQGSDMSPIEVGRRLSDAADAVIQASLQNAMQRLVDIRGMPTRPDGTTPAVTVLATGPLGARELSYTSPFRLIFLFDSIDHRNVYHRQFYEALVEEVVTMLGGDPSRHDTPIAIDLRENPRHEVGAPICGFFDAIRIYETSGRLDQRLRFTKARVVAGSLALGDALIERMIPWVYRQYLTRADLAEAALMRRKLERLEDRPSGAGFDIVHSAGGRLDIERTIGFLQLMHGAALSSVRRGSTLDAIDALRAGGCLSIDEAALLSDNHARLCRLQNQLWITLGKSETTLPVGAERGQIAAVLGLTNETGPDVERFESMLARTLQRNRDAINHLVVGFGFGNQSSAAETELVLDPDPDPELVARTMRDHGITDPTRAMSHLASLANETVRFLSPHRCRHFFSMIAPALLDEVTRTPDPDRTLASIVDVTDSLGAKASLWELLGSNRPTMKLLVRLCAAAPYLARILVDNPGMIDELIDSLLMDRLPSAGRLDAHSIEVCRGATDIDLILRGFKNGSHLTIGVRDILGKETLEATHAAIGDVAESCVRRCVEFEYARLAEQFGDPVDDDGEPVEPVVLTSGKLGGREPNYHSDLELVFLYTADGQTRRRVGGPRSTTSNSQFFEALATSVLARLQNAMNGPPLYSVASHLHLPERPQSLAASIDEFFQIFSGGPVAAWRWMQLSKTRPMMGNRTVRRAIEQRIESALAHATWDDAMSKEVRSTRLVMEETARPENIKRGAGGTLDSEFVAAAMTLKAAGKLSTDSGGTTQRLASLGRVGAVDPADAETLIRGYRTLRRVESHLRLMDTQARHDLPTDDVTKKYLAYLMSEPNPDSILRSVDEARRLNRQAFDKYLPG